MSHFILSRRGGSAARRLTRTAIGGSQADLEAAVGRSDETPHKDPPGNGIRYIGTWSAAGTRGRGGADDGQGGAALGSLCGAMERRIRRARAALVSRTQRRWRSGGDRSADLATREG
jgi:hypothetical protein